MCIFDHSLNIAWFKHLFWSRPIEQHETQNNEHHNLVGILSGYHERIMIIGKKKVKQKKRKKKSICVHSICTLKPQLETKKNNLLCRWVSLNFIYLITKKTNLKFNRQHLLILFVFISKTNFERFVWSLVVSFTSVYCFSVIFHYFMAQNIHYTRTIPFDDDCMLTTAHQHS